MRFSTAFKRLEKEAKDMAKQTAPYVNAGPKSADNLLDWDAIIVGKPSTPFEYGMWELGIKCSTNYPFRAPTIWFKGVPPYHPNISRRGQICLDTLDDGWTAALTIEKALLSISALLDDPNADDPLFTEAAQLYKTDINAYNDRARAHTRRNAM